ncbi:phosphate signaling complex protein PhoU [Bifidobacterium vansinderenii]|uniref:Phosphate-specific transport system accessory protein PhoU n=1 Tax=Bifidobacterium vansinderenii TaxID=1984871 RepID=A0A229VYS1_9BIFI|nr:phosphate signaling complex protein PhoU [Bifidobacterium vansinderenii]OXN00757.1 PhoU family transcriptional regulator [Bifidobacterium vansinderenii]
MRVIFTEEMKQVADDLDRMAQEVRTAILGAGKALLESDVEVAQNVIDGDLEIDALETSVINQCVQLLARQNPVATDLRVVVSTLRLASTFERMGDLARHVAEIARRTYPESALTPETREVFSKMQQFLDETTEELIHVLSNRDVKAAEQLIINDDKLDALHLQIFDIVNSDQWTGTTQQTIDVVLLGRFYERFGDHAVSAARRLVYIVSGFDPTKAPQTKADSSAKDPYLSVPEK